MDLEDLRYFVAAYEAADLTESAPRHLRLDASAGVRRLETVLGSRLFEEQNGRARATPAGEELYAHARRVLATSTGQTTIPVR
jgi:DNA-binding transcriptional LysR family regulator